MMSRNEAPPKTFTALPQIDANLIFAQNMACMAMLQAQQWEAYATKLNLHAIQKKRTANPPRFALIRAGKENNEMVSRLLEQASSSSSAEAPAAEPHIASAAFAAPPTPRSPLATACATHATPVTHTTTTTTTRTVQQNADHAPAEAHLAEAAAEVAHAAAHAAAVEAATEAAQQQHEVAVGLHEEALAAPRAGDARPQQPRDNAWVRNRMGFILKFAFLLVLFEATLFGLLVYFFFVLLFLYGLFDGVLAYFAAGRHPALDQQLVNLRIRREAPPGRAAAGAADEVQNAAEENDAGVNAAAAPPAGAPGGFWRAFYQSFVMFFLTLAPWWTPDPRLLQ